MGSCFSCISCVFVYDSDNLHKKKGKRRKAKTKNLYTKGKKNSSSQDPTFQHVTSTSEVEVLCIAEEPGHAEVNGNLSSILSVDILQATVCATSDCKDDVPSVPVFPTSDCRDDDPPVPVCATSDCRDGEPPGPVCATSECRDDVPHVEPTEDTVLKQLEENSIINVSFCSYEVGRKLGEGGYGSVYAGTRLKDGLKVALKIAGNVGIDYINIEDNPDPVPLEIGLLILANKGPRVPQIIQLLDWVEEPDRYIMVLEFPTPCESLFEFLDRYNDCVVGENVAKVIMHQATVAAQTCCQRGVFHRDIKLENLLINPDTLDVKLIDFGCGDILTDAGYTSFFGTEDYCPPEYELNGLYHGKPATVWSLGVLMFGLLCEDFPHSEDLDKLNDNSWVKDGLSQECCKLLCSLLQRYPEKRLELDDVCLHNWFKSEP